jgi:SecD/SecF fusion protein
MPILALLFFGGSTLKDFAFALLIGVASGAYSSIFIASPVLTHWKEREAVYRARRHRIEGELGYVPAYAGTGADVEPVVKRPRRTGRLTQPQPETVSAAEFEQMKRDLDVERRPPSRQTSTGAVTKRAAQTKEPPPPPARPAPPGDGRGDGRGDGIDGGRAPDIPENEGVAPAPKPKRPPKSRSRNRRHGRRR